MQNVSEDDFQTNFILHTAVVKWFEIIGEASCQITKNFKDRNTDIHWEAIEGLRQILVHEYFGIDLLKVWELYKTEINELKEKINKLYNEYK